MESAEGRAPNRELDRAKILWALAREAPQPGIDDTPDEARRAADDPSRTFGKFLLVGPLGRGGTSSVHKAWQTDLRRFVALKILETRDEDAAARFGREAALAARLVHPNIAPVYAAGATGGRHYLAMQLIEGRSLESGGLDHRRAAEAVRDAARAVHYAHENGVIHRDLKPHNILLDGGGHLWVTDFGTARHMSHGSTVTASGRIVGTPCYMAPEQVRGEAAADRRTDVYGLGATLYHLLTGKPPFEGTEVVPILKKVEEEEPVPPRRIDPSIPRPLEHVVLKCLEKDPARRYATAGELAEDIDRFLSGRRTAAGPPGTLRKLGRLAGRHRAVAAALAVLAAVGAFAAAREGYRTWRLSATRQEAARMEAAGDEGAAAALYRKALSMAPADVAAEEGLRRIDRRRAAREWAARGRAAEEERRRAAREMEEMRLRAAALREAIDDNKSPLDEKLRLWALEDALKQKSSDDGRLLGEAVAAYTRALELDPGTPGLRESLARLHVEEFERADRVGDLHAASAARKTAEMLDDGRLAGRLFRGGELSLDTSPGGAEAVLARFVPAADRRLVPEKDGRRLGRSPLRSVRVERGSYLVTLRKEGYQDARLHIMMNHGTKVEEIVPLYTADEIGDGFVYVPPGEFVAGGDAQAAYEPARPARVRAEGFFISRAEVSCKWYDSVMGRPRGHAGCAGDGPVRGVSWDDAAAFCRKLSAGDPSAEYRLPTELEWEKAARGADGRAFPWGDYFDWAYLKRPKFDVSPYGVEAVASGAREWCADWYDKEMRYKVVRGGSADLTLEPFFRCASRVWFEPAKRPPDVGFRVVKIPRRR